MSSSKAKSDPKAARPEKAGRRRRPMASEDPISAGLRRMWADAEQEPVPEDLLALLDEIDAAAGITGQGDNSGQASREGKA